MVRPDNRKVGVKDVSAEAGVALSTVSHVLNGTAPISDEVRARVLDAARRLGYLAKRQKKGTIASLSALYLAVPPSSLPHNDVNLFSWTILTALTRECERRAIRIVPHSGTGALSAAEIIAGAKGAGVDGVVLFHDDSPKLLKALAASGLAVVLLNGEDPSMTVDTVTPANRFGARLATDWLIARGHRRILHLTWRGRGTIRRRMDGFLDAFIERDLPRESAEVIFAGGYEPADGEAAIRGFLAARRGCDGFTALFCAADNLAVGALRALAEAGVRVPQDLAVVGFDGVALGDFTQPPLATVRVPLDHLAIAAVDALEKRLGQSEVGLPPCRIEIGCRLIERESAGSPLS